MKKKTAYPSPGGTKASGVLQERPPTVAEPTSRQSMVRTQIYLSQEEYGFLQAEAKRRDEPMASVIRGFIDEKMTIPEEAWENNPLLQPPEDDPTYIHREDGALNHDHYVYGGPKKYKKVRGKWVLEPPLD